MKKFITLSMLFMATAVFAQEETTEPAAAPAGLTVSGSVDVYHQTYLSGPATNPAPFGTSFADQAGFGLGMANTVFSYEGAKTGAVADLAFGPRGVDAVGGGKAQFVNQLYAYWNVSENTKLTMGRWNTYVGYEVIAPAANFNYSTSYLFSNGPFSMVGLKADFSLSDDFTAMVAIMNPTDVNNNHNGQIALGGQLGYKGQFLNLYYAGNPPVGSATLSGITPGGVGFEIDYTGGFDVTEEFFLGINAAMNTNKITVAGKDYETGFYGVALYPQYALSEDFSLGLRSEYFARPDQGDLDKNKKTTDLSVLATTLTASYTVENLIIKPEIRLDSWSNGKLYLNNATPAKATESLAAFTLAAIYTF
jgi:hypothetical protein